MKKKIPSLYSTNSEGVKTVISDELVRSVVRDEIRAYLKGQGILKKKVIK
jgi:hypothetical protein